MSKYELANEGCTTPAGEQAFSRYNEILQKQPDQLSQAIALLALNQTIPETHSRAAAAITDVLDTTNNGTQIGIGPDTETGWAQVFDDDEHREAQHSHVEQAALVRELSYELARARRDLEQSGTDAGSDMAGIVNELETAYDQAVEELIARRRLRGMQTLRVIARLNGAREMPVDLPLAA